MNKPQQLFKLPDNPKPAGQVHTPTQQQQANANKLRLIFVGIFLMMAFPMFAKIYFKGPLTSLFISIYWVIIIAIGLFFLGRFIRTKFFKKE